MTFLDTSILVGALLEKHPEHAACLEALEGTAGPFTDAHALAETYRTLTTLHHPIPPAAAAKLVVGLQSTLRVVDLPRAVYHAALAEVARQGLAGAIVYDAVHCFAARAGNAGRIVTRNAPHFRLFAGTIEVVGLTA